MQDCQHHPRTSMTSDLTSVGNVATHGLLATPNARTRRGVFEMPERVQLSRKKGWRKPENTVVVSRPSRWGNPFRITREACDESTDDGYCWVVRPEGRRFDVAHNQTQIEARASAVDEYKVWVMCGRTPYNSHEVKAQLRGKNLACWCPLAEPCHADVLLEIANRDDT